MIEKILDEAFKHVSHEVGLQSVGMDIGTLIIVGLVLTAACWYLHRINEEAKEKWPQGYAIVSFLVAVLILTVFLCSWITHC